MDLPYDVTLYLFKFLDIKTTFNYMSMTKTMFNLTYNMYSLKEIYKTHICKDDRVINYFRSCKRKGQTQMDFLTTSRNNILKYDNVELVDCSWNKSQHSIFIDKTKDYVSNDISCILIKQFRDNVDTTPIENIIQYCEENKDEILYDKIEEVTLKPQPTHIGELPEDCHILVEDWELPELSTNPIEIMQETPPPDHDPSDDLSEILNMDMDDSVQSYIIDRSKEIINVFDEPCDNVKQLDPHNYDANDNYAKRSKPIDSIVETNEEDVPLEENPQLDYYQLIKLFYIINNKFNKMFDAYDKIYEIAEKIRLIEVSDDYGQSNDLVVSILYPTLDKLFVNKLTSMIINNYVYIKNIPKYIIRLLELYHIEKQAQNNSHNYIQLGNNQTQLIYKSAGDALQDICQNHMYVFDSPCLTENAIDQIINLIVSDYDSNNHMFLPNVSIWQSANDILRSSNNSSSCICRLLRNNNLSPAYIQNTLINFTSELWLMDTINGFFIRNTYVFNVLLYCIITCLKLLSTKKITITIDIYRAWINLFMLAKTKVCPELSNLPKISSINTGAYTDIMLNLPTMIYINVLHVFVLMYDIYSKNRKIKCEIEDELENLLNINNQNIELCVTVFNYFYKIKLMSYYLTGKVYSNDLLDKYIFPTINTILQNAYNNDDESMPYVTSFQKYDKVRTFINQNIFKYVTFFTESELTNKCDDILYNVPYQFNESISQIITTCKIKTYYLDYIHKKINEYNLNDSVKTIITFYKDHLDKTEYIGFD